jgi:enoyl-CoA hydratase/carnithine racemase
MMRRRCIVAVPIAAQRVRGIKTLTVRDREVLGMAREFREYQRITTNPFKLQGPQFNTHFSSRHRIRDKMGVIDWLHWGKEVGQAYAPHRRQRTTFDYHDKMHPTSLPKHISRGGLHEGQDPTSKLQDVQRGFRPAGYSYNEPIHANRRYTLYRAGQADVSLESGPFADNAAVDLATKSAVSGATWFGVTPPHTADGDTPGIHKPFRGEQDGEMMQAMTKPVPGTKDNAVVHQVGRYTRHLYINRPTRDNRLTRQSATDLAMAIDRSTTAMRTKLTVLTAAQSGQTDAYCAGADYEQLAFYKRQERVLRAAAEKLRAEDKKHATALELKQRDVEIQNLVANADRYRSRVDDTLRALSGLVWRVFTAQRPLMTLVNGRCHNFGNGVALLARYASVRDSTELVHDGPSFGATPAGGMTHLLARTETTLKYPGVAEYVMLSGFPLYAGDALRLGWTDLFSNIADMGYQIREWFADTEQMHNDAVAWQLGHLLDTCFKMRDTHDEALERCALRPTRARWIEEAFADQPSVETVLETLSAVEKLPLSDSNNTTDENTGVGWSLHDVDAGVHKLRKNRLSFSLAPWDASMPASETAAALTSTFREVYFGRAGDRSALYRPARATAKQFHRERRKEFEAYRRQVMTPHKRHVHVVLEGCEKLKVDFEFDFIDVEDAPAGKTPKVRLDGENKAQLVERLLRRINTSLGFDESRPLLLLWHLPTLDTAPVRRDTELIEVLHEDPGIENPEKPTAAPPIYFTVVRQTLHFSEWAYAVKHQLLLSSPFALKASWALLQAVRGDGAAESVASVSESLALEFRYLTRAINRPDFYKVGVLSTMDEAHWANSNDTSDLTKAHLPLRAEPAFDEVFEKDVEIDGHRFAMRPRWEPRTVAEVSEADISALAKPLSFTQEGLTDIHVPTEANLADRVAGTVLEIQGYEITPLLGSDSKSAPAPLKSDAHVPNNVNFYEMARHPFKDQPTSWRSHGFTQGSEEYFKGKYDEAVKEVYDPAGEGRHEYWAGASKATEAPTGAEPEEELLQDRFWNAINNASQSVEHWVQELQAQAVAGKFSHTLEVTTVDEKVYDDNYYRWFIKSGQSPNPSGILRTADETKKP